MLPFDEKAHRRKEGHLAFIAMVPCPPRARYALLLGQTTNISIFMDLPLSSPILHTLQDAIISGQPIQPSYPPPGSSTIDKTRSEQGTCHHIIIEHVSGRPDQGPEHPLPNRAGLHHLCCRDMPQYACMYCILPGLQKKASRQ